MGTPATLCPTTIVNVKVFFMICPFPSRFYVISFDYVFILNSFDYLSIGKLNNFVYFFGLDCMWEILSSFAACALPIVARVVGCLYMGVCAGRDMVSRCLVIITLYKYD